MLQTMSRFLFGLLLLGTTSINPAISQTADEVLFRQGLPSSISLADQEGEVVKTAVAILQQDVKTVLNVNLELTAKDANIIVATIGKSSTLPAILKSLKLDVSAIRGKWERFLMRTVIYKGHKRLLIIGSDDRGTAYGVLELSRQLGVSPWEWWADVRPEPLKQFAFPKELTSKSPSVQYRGIFLNDEDWGLLPWSSKTFEPGLATVAKTKGAIGPKTYGKIFELLLRLRANTIWPAMHEVTVPFYLSKGNKEMADKYGIIVGTSHCEPLMRNSVNEWDLYGKGDYNYKTNKEEILSYWTSRLKELKGSENMYTIGLRGKHDGMMQGVKTLKEHKEVLTQVIADQRQLIAKYVKSDVSQVPQVFIPYKEVLDVYNDGLQVPDDVSLIWCDDNYGYLTHFPTLEERKRSGGNGVYYHLSYWGRPHDYLWLGTANPALMLQQMQRAYEKDARKIWIVNVGDIKPTEYQMELFLDMAWDMDQFKSKDLDPHLKRWLGNAFGAKQAEVLLPIMKEHYRLAFIRKPEFMGNTRGEEKDPKYKIVSDLPWTEAEIRERLKDYDHLYRQVYGVASQLSDGQQSAFFELVQYPVQAAALMNRKTLVAQLARHGKAKWEDSDAAYEEIIALTARFNALEGGKWNRMMNDQPHSQSVFEKIPKTIAVQPLVESPKVLKQYKAGEYITAKGKLAVYQGLGYSGQAVALEKGTSFSFALPAIVEDSITVELRLLPTHPVTGKSLRLSVSLDDSKGQSIDYRTYGRSEEWKQNVLRNQSIRILKLPTKRGKAQQLNILASDEGVIVDEIIIR